MRKSWRVVVSSSVLVAAFAVTASLDAQSRPRGRGETRAAIAVGDAGARAGGPTASSELELALRSALATHPSVTLSPDRTHARFVVTGSVVELSQHPLAEGEREIRCRVSLVVADAHGGAVRAMLEGRAGVRGGGTEDAMRRSAVRGAVTSALRSIAQVR